MQNGCLADAMGEAQGRRRPRRCRGGSTLGAYLVGVARIAVEEAKMRYLIGGVFVALKPLPQLGVILRWLMAHRAEIQLL